MNLVKAQTSFFVLPQVHFYITLDSKLIVLLKTGFGFKGLIL